MKKIFLTVLILMISSVCFAGGPPAIPPTTGSFSVTDITGQTDDSTPATTATAVLAQGGSLIESSLAEMAATIFASPSFTTQMTLSNAFVIKPAASTNGHTYILGAWGTDNNGDPAFYNMCTITNVSSGGNNLYPIWSCDNVDLRLPVLSFNATANAMDDDHYNGQIVRGLNAGEAITQWDCVYLDPTETEWMTADNTSLNTTVSPDRPKRCEGLAVATGSNGVELNVIVKGVIRNDGWNWTADLPVYLTTTGDLTQTVPTTASGFKQEVGIATTDDEIYVDPKPIDWGITRTSADADGRTLNCIEASNTVWMATGAGTFTLPAVAECPTLNGAVITVGAVAVILDVNASDRQVQDGVANADGDSSTNTSTAGDMITYGYYDADGPWTQTNGWTAN